MVKWTKAFVVVVICFWITPQSEAEDELQLLNFREILASYEAITGIRSTQPEIRTIYRAVADRLPIYGDPAELSSPTVLALTELSGVFCNELVKKEAAVPAAERSIFQYVDFKDGPRQFSSNARNELLRELTLFVWQRGPMDDELTKLIQTFEQTIEGRTGSPLVTQSVLTVLCTTLGTSLEFLVK